MCTPFSLGRGGLRQNLPHEGRHTPGAQHIPSSRQLPALEALLCARTSVTI